MQGLRHLTAAPGAYVLVVALPAPLALPVASLSPGGPPVVLAPGTYAYCGSANGPGGIRARVGRHLRAGKRMRWHIDHLTGAGRVRAILAEPGGSECRLFARLRAMPGAGVPVPGFGSSDCRRCPAHLLSLPAAFDARALAGLAGGAGARLLVLERGPGEAGEGHGAGRRLIAPTPGRA